MAPIRRNYNLTFFSDLVLDICPKIIRDHTVNQWLIFVQQKRDYSLLQTKLKSHGISTLYLDAGKKTSKRWNFIIQSGTFSEKVLISTKVLENGVSLINPNLKHIVLTTSDKVEMLQMVGRKRLSPDESISLYVQNFSAEQLQFHCTYAQEGLKTVARWHKNPIEVLQSYWSKWGNPQYRFSRLFSLRSNGNLVLNALAEYKLNLQFSFYNQLYQDTVMHQFQDLVTSWLNVERSFEVSVNHDDAKTEIGCFLEANYRGPLSRGAPQTDFKDSLFKLLHKYITDLRADQSHRKASINSGLERLGLPYRLKSEKGQLILQNINIIL